MEKNNFKYYYNKAYSGFLKNGKKSYAHLVLKKTYKNILLQNKRPAYVLKTSVDNVSPLFILKTQKRGRLVLQKPFPIFDQKKRIASGFKWIIESLQKTKANDVSKVFSQELSLNYQNQGYAKKKQQELHNLVVRNRSSLL